MIYKKYEIVLVNLNPTIGSEQRGVRPCLIIQNNEANKYSNTFVIAVISSVIKKFPHTFIIDPSKINNLKEQSRIDLLQIRTIDKKRVIKKIGKLDEKYSEKLKDRLSVAFDLNDDF